MSEVQSRAVVRRRGEGGDRCCIDCVLKTPDERDPDTQRVPPKFSFKLVVVVMNHLNSGDRRPFWLSWVNRDRLCGASALILVASAR